MNANARSLPSALDRLPEIRELARGRSLALFLDYDGTLTPIVSRPELAVLSEEMRERLRRLAASIPVSILSGRGLADLRALVGLDELIYAGSHGFEIEAPGGRRQDLDEALALLPELGAAEQELIEALAETEGARVERKRFSVAAHYRLVDAERTADVRRAVTRVAAGHPGLRQASGKKVLELRPALDWHKGKALLWVLGWLGLDSPDALPVFIGDDITDEDAFEAVAAQGIGVIVRDDARPTAAGYALENTAEVGKFLDVIEDLARSAE